MATRNRKPSADPYQSVVDVQAMLAYVSCAIHESWGGDLDFGRYLILMHCRDRLNEAKEALEPKPHALEAVNG
jgi:hypothetical protein